MVLVALMVIDVALKEVANAAVAVDEVVKELAKEVVLGIVNQRGFIGWLSNIDSFSIYSANNPSLNKLRKCYLIF